MATRKKRTKKTPARRASKPKQELITWEDELLKLAKEEAERTPLGVGNTISTRGGVFTYQGADLGEELDVIIIDHVFYNVYFDRPFDPDSPTPPACFALSPDPKNEPLAPDEDVPSRQCETCKPCWANEFGSDNRSKGKACANTVRLGVMPGDAEDVTEAEVAMLNVSPTGVANFTAHVSKVFRSTRRPVLGVVTTLGFDDKYDYPRLTFKLKDLVTKENVQKLLALRGDVRETLMAPPDTAGYEPPSGGGRGRSGGGRKKKATHKKKASGGRKKKASGRSKFS